MCQPCVCGCGLVIESTQHSFFFNPFYHIERLELLNSFYDLAINELNEDSIINLILFGSDKYHKETNSLTSAKAIKNIDKPLL